MRKPLTLFEDIVGKEFQLKGSLSKIYSIKRINEFGDYVCKVMEDTEWINLGPCKPTNNNHILVMRRIHGFTFRTRIPLSKVINLTKPNS